MQEQLTINIQEQTKRNTTV